MSWHDEDPFEGLEKLGRPFITTPDGGSLAEMGRGAFGSKPVVRLVNLTPHTVEICDDDGLILSLQSQGCARVKATTIPVATVMGGVPLVRQVYGDVEGLPEPQPDTLYIVSQMVRQALPDRTDLASPGELVRDEAGRVVGCKGLVIS